jgi:diacylglycerol kinase
MRHKNLIQSFSSALAGFRYCFKTQRNFRIHLLFAFIVSLFAYFLQVTIVESLVLFFTIILVLTLEMINTAFEYLIDVVSPEWREKARVAKDMAAAAILTAAFGAVVVAMTIFGPYLLKFMF